MLHNLYFETRNHIEHVENIGNLFIEMLLYYGSFNDTSYYTSIIIIPSAYDSNESTFNHERSSSLNV